MKNCFEYRVIHVLDLLGSVEHPSSDAETILDNCVAEINVKMPTCFESRRLLPLLRRAYAPEVERLDPAQQVSLCVGPAASLES